MNRLMHDIEITQLKRPFQSRHQSECSNKHQKYDFSKSRIDDSKQKNRGHMLRQLSSNDSFGKKIVPIRQYSNKFLRQSQSKENAYRGTVHSFVPTNKQKLFHKKCSKIINRKQFHNSKTEENEPDPHLITSNNFCELPKDEKRLKTESEADKKHLAKNINKCNPEQPMEYSHHLERSEDQNKPKNGEQDKRQEGNSKTKNENSVVLSREQKISTSRALQLFSKIVSKDRGDLLEKIRICNQKKLLKERLMESSKNLQAKQIVLSHKTKKFSLVQKCQRKLSIKTSLRYRNNNGFKQSQFFQDDEQFEIKGWDNPL